MQRLLDLCTLLLYASGVMFFVYMAYTVHREHVQMSVALQEILTRLK